MLTNSTLYYELFTNLERSKIYYTKINNPDYYLHFIENNQDNDELEDSYQNYTKNYDKKKFDWVYYYVYMILLIDYEQKINHRIYELIVSDIIQFMNYSESQKLEFIEYHKKISYHKKLS